MPPYHGVGLRAEEKGMIEHFAAVAEAADSDHGAGRTLERGGPIGAVLTRLAREVPLVRSFKIEVAGAAPAPAA